MHAPAVAVVVFINNALYCRTVCTADSADLSFICTCLTILCFIIKLMRDSRQNPRGKLQWSCHSPALGFQLSSARLATAQLLEQRCLCACVSECVALTEPGPLLQQFYNSSQLTWLHSAQVFKWEECSLMSELFQPSLNHLMNCHLTDTEISK